MGGAGVLVLLAVGFIFGRKWTKIRAFVESAAAEVRKR